MDSVKRRLVYVADDNEELVRQLTAGGTPPTRASRFSRVHVSASASSRSSSKRTVSPHVVSPVPSPAADTLLIVSYDGNMVADGSGCLRCPRNYGEARVLRRELRKCALFLTQYMHKVGRSVSSEESTDADLCGSPSSSSSSSYSGSSGDDDDDEEDEDSDGEDEPRQRRRHAPSKRQAGRARTDGASASRLAPSDIKLMTAANLRDALRERGLPVAGNKATLEERLRMFSEEEAEEPPPHPLAHATHTTTTTSMHAEAAVEPADHRPSRRSGVKRTREPSTTLSFASPRSGSTSDSSSQRLSQHRFSHVISPAAREVSATEPTRRSRSLWGALVTVGSRLFGPTPASQSPYTAARHTDEDGTREPDAKRRRSA